MVRPTAAIACLATLLLMQAAYALPLQSNHGSLQAVPAPGPITIDGRLEDWDLTGEIYVYGIRQKRDFYAARVHAMWDRDALYLGLKWRDPTPMFNKVDPDTAPEQGWMSDSFQARFVTDWSQIHLTAWYSSEKDRSVVDIRYDQPLNAVGKYQHRGAGPSMQAPGGFAMAFRRDPDNRGYVQEMRIPWALLWKKPAIQAGLKFRFTGEYFWGGASGTKWPAVMWSDPIDQKNPVRIVVYQNPHIWGEMVLLDKGNLPVKKAEEFDQLLQGPVPIRMEVPKEATHFSLVIDDHQGRRVRNLVSHQRIADYVVKSDDGKRRIEVPWDGRADGEWDRERSLFLGEHVSAGTYFVRGVTHSGLGVVYAGSFYNPGTPPWPTADGSGGWGFDHSPPIAVSAMPPDSTSKGRVFLGWRHGEAGFGFIGLNDEGRKIWSWVHLGAGAHFIAAGKKFVYFQYRGGTNQHLLARVNPDTGKQIPFAGGVVQLDLGADASGLAVHGNILAASIAGQNKVVLFDAETGARGRELKVTAPGSIAFRPDGKLVGISGSGFFKADPGAGVVKQFALPGVTKPAAIAFDRSGQMYVSNAETQTVEVFDKADTDGKQVRQIGERGGHRPGPWNPQRMNSAVSLAVEERADGARLWATEDSQAPRRVSVWNTSDGRLRRDYIGNTFYMGHGGLLSDDEPTRGVFAGVLFDIDYKNYRSSPVEIMGGRPDPQPGKTSLFRLGYSPPGAAIFGNGYLFTSNVSGKAVEYYVEGHSLPMVFQRRGGRWMCVAAVGRADSGITFPAGFPKAPAPNALFCWNDLNADGFQSPEEVSWYDPGRPGVLHHKLWGYRCDRDLTWYHSGLAIQPVRFTDDGAPVYDLSKIKTLPGDLGSLKGDIYRTRFGYVHHGPHDAKYRAVDKHNVIHGLNQLAGYDSAGIRRWTYPSYWVSVHGAFSAPMATPGVIMGLLKVSGIVDLGDHSVISCRGNTGQEFLIRDDGVYLGELFTDQRMAPSSMPEEMKIAGLPINDTTLGGEPFNGWIGRQKDGKVRLTYGETDVRIAEVTGLDTIRPLAKQPLPLTADQVTRCKAFTPKRGGAEQKTELVVTRGGPIGLGAKGFDDPGAVSLLSGREEVGKAELRYDDKHLYVGWRVFDATPLQNKGSVPALAFKTGDSVSLHIAPDGHYAENQVDGTRVLLTVLSGKPVAVVYRRTGTDGKPYVFESPVRTSRFAHVDVEPAIKMQAVPGGAGNTEYTVTATIPWPVLGVTPKPGLKLRGDIGILLSDDTGTRTDRRVHWADRQTNVINDVPTEAEGIPARWGLFILK